MQQFKYLKDFGLYQECIRAKTDSVQFYLQLLGPHSLYWKITSQLAGCHSNAFGSSSCIFLSIVYHEKANDPAEVNPVRKGI